MTLLEKIHDFNASFQAETRYNPDGLRELPPLSDFYNRREILFLEEWQELKRALNAGDVVEELDATVDMIYILLGTAVNRFGVDTIQQAFDLVHANNMNKFFSPEEVIQYRDRSDVTVDYVGNNRYVVKRVEDGKVIKKVGFGKVDLKHLVQ